VGYLYPDQPLLDTCHDGAGSRRPCRNTPLESSPPPALCTTELPPPIKEDIEPLQELEHQQPAPQAEAALSGALFQPEDPPPGGKTGVERQGKDQTKSPTCLQHSSTSYPKICVRLRGSSPSSSKHRARVDRKSDSERLTLSGHRRTCLCHRLLHPCGLFAELIRYQLWHYVTDSDEDCSLGASETALVWG